MLKQSKSKDFFSRLHEQRYGIMSRQLLKDVQEERKRQTQQEHSIRLESSFEPPPLPKHTAKDFYKLIKQLNTRTYEDLIAEERAQRMANQSPLHNIDVGTLSILRQHSKLSKTQRDSQSPFTRLNTDLASTPRAINRHLSLKRPGKTIDSYGHLVQKNGNVIFADEVPAMQQKIQKF